MFDSKFMNITSVVICFTLFIGDEKGKFFLADDYHTGTPLWVN